MFHANIIWAWAAVYKNSNDGNCSLYQSIRTRNPINFKNTRNILDILFHAIRGVFQRKTYFLKLISKKHFLECKIYILKL